MPWTDRQRTIFHAAANKAGWTPERRYIAMKHVGCPLDAKEKRPSVTHRGNTQAMFDRCMALAEACAAERGERITPPGRYKSWREAERHQGDRARELVRRIAHEAVTLLPEVFVAPDDVEPALRLIEATTAHVCGFDDPEFLPFDGVARFETLDVGQLYRVTESLKARVGRELAERGMTPRTFDVPAEAKRRAASNLAKKAGAA